MHVEHSEHLWTQVWLNSRQFVFTEAFAQTRFIWFLTEHLRHGTGSQTTCRGKELGEKKLTRNQFCMKAKNRNTRTDGHDNAPTVIPLLIKTHILKPSHY